MRADGSSAEAYAARSQAHIKLGDYIQAADDANRAIELDPGFAKGHLRRGCVGTVWYETQAWFENASSAVDLGFARVAPWRNPRGAA